MAKKKRKVLPQNPVINILNTVKERLFDTDKLNLALGLLVLIIWVFMVVSFLSFFFTGASDASKLEGSFFKQLMNANESYENWAGKLGAYLSNYFINNNFGLGAFAMLYVLFVAGLQLMRVKIENLRRALVYSLLGMIWLSLFFGFFFVDGYEDSYLFLGGRHGYYMGKWISSAIGYIGTVFVILFLSFVFFLFAVPNSTELLKRIPAFFESRKSKALTRDTEFDEDDLKEDPVSEKQGEDDEDEFTAEIKTEEKPEEELEPDTAHQPEEELVAETELEEELTSPETIGSSKLAEEQEEDDLSSEDFEVQRAPEEPSIDDHSEQNMPSGEPKDDSLELEVEKQVEEELVRKNRVERGEGDYDPKLDLSHYKYPKLEHLIDYPNNVEVTKEELEDNKNRILQTLENYGIAIDSIKATIGPTVTLYEIIPAAGVRIAKIRNLEDDIALSLSALGIRIIAPIPGKGTIGIEVPNSKPEMVSMRSVVASVKFQDTKYELPVAMGKTITNETYVFDLAKMPHLLVAGATGQGKSVGLNAIIASLIYKKHPAQLKFVMVDPKKVELSIYSKIEKHFLAKMPDQEEAIINDVSRVVQTLNSLTVEMDQRYDLLKNARARNIKEYNHKFIKRQLNPLQGHKYLPYMVIIIDEFADLIMTAGKEVELPIARIAQLARAVGIHMVIATQRPSTNIITGVIKANFPARIAFKVSSMIDSRTIIDSPGANQLIGRGDMLISHNSEVIRLQCAFIDTPEVEAIVDSIHDQQGYPNTFELPEYVGEESGGSDLGEDPLGNLDNLFKEAAQIVILHQSGSTSLLQRKFSVGYNRAGRIMDQLEAAHIVGPFEGSKARKVMFQDEASLEQHLADMGL